MLGSIIGAALPIIGGIIGRDQSGGDRRTADEMNAAALAQLQGLTPPEVEALKLNLEGLQSAGQLTPQQEQAQQLAARDALQDVNLDPRLKQAQMNQLELLQKIGTTGITPAEQAQMNQMRQSVEADNQARTKQMLEQQQARGLGSSESALAARMLGAQAEANRQSQSTQDLAGQAFNRALQATSQAGGLAGNMEAADYSRQANLANALNAREQYNVGQKANVGNRNVDRFNTAQAANLANAQRLSDANTGIRNQQQQYNKNLLVDDYGRKVDKAQLVSGGLRSRAGDFSSRAEGTEANAIGMTEGLTKGGMALANAFNTKPAEPKKNNYDGFDPNLV